MPDLRMAALLVTIRPCVAAPDYQSSPDSLRMMFATPATRQTRRPTVAISLHAASVMPRKPTLARRQILPPTALASVTHSIPVVKNSIAQTAIITPAVCRSGGRLVRRARRNTLRPETTRAPPVIMGGSRLAVIWISRTVEGVTPDLLSGWVGEDRDHTKKPTFHVLFG